MDTTVPFHAGFLLGRSVDMKSLKPGFFTSDHHFEPAAHEVNFATNKYALATSLREVCDIFDLSPEYALKVKGGVIENSMIEACMKTLGSQDAFTLIFRQTFLHKKQYVPHETAALLSKSKLKQGDALSSQSPESMIADAVKDASLQEQSLNEGDVKHDSFQSEAVLVDDVTEDPALSLQSMDRVSLEEPRGSGCEISQISVEIGGGDNPTSSLSGHEGVDRDSSQSQQAHPIGATVLGAEAVGLSARVNDSDTHFVTAQEVGNEQVVIVRVTCPDGEKFQKFLTRLCDNLESAHGELDLAKVEKLKKLAPQLDEKISKKSYHDMKVDFEYCSFEEKEQYPASFSGMIEFIESFIDQSQGWADKCMQGVGIKMDQRFMSLHVGDYVEEKSRLTSIKNAVSGFFSSDSTTSTSGQALESAVDSEENHDSFIVLESEPSHFFPIRVTLRSYENEVVSDGDKSFTSLALSQYPESTHSLFNRFFNTLCQCDAAVETLINFMSTKRFFLENRDQEVNTVLKSVQNMQIVVHEAIKSLDFVTVPDELTLETITTANPLDTVQGYIENVTSKLPPGQNLDILMIGKTGHGKSATGNSVLGQRKFVSAADGESVTADTSMGWADVDGRVLKVVDTPGVCDTKETDEGSINLAIRSISDAISHCPQGFNALLLIIRFGVRMTDEEKKAIAMLKCVLGNDVVKSHCVCVVTYGDNFKTEMSSTKDPKTFEQWCRSQTGFLKSLFEECDYRCVLFNNVTEDPKEKKAQLIQLINKIDSFKDQGVKYTNNIFEFAQRERERTITDQQAPQVEEETIRDIQLILDYLNNMVKNTGDSNYSKELESLKARVETLKSRVADGQGEQLGGLVETVFGLAGAVHAKLDEIADQTAQPPGEGAAGATGETGETPDTATGDTGETPDTATGETPVTENNSSPEEGSTFLKNLAADGAGPLSLDDCRRDLQNYYDEQVAPQNQTVNEKVAEKVSEEIKNTANCFPGDATVWLSDGNQLPMSKVEIGDEVMVRDTDGKVKFDTVYMFGHKDPIADTEFIVLTTATSLVSVSKEHVVYCIRDGQEECVSARDIMIGDCLLIIDKDASSLASAEVIGLQYARKQGLFAPFTLSGTLVVNSTLMSCYVDKVSPGTAHKMLWPVRQLYRVSPQLLEWVNRNSKGETVPWWARVSLKCL